MEGACMDQDPKGYLVYDNSSGWHYFSASDGQHKPHPPNHLRRFPGSSDWRRNAASIQHTRAYGFAVLFTSAGILLAATILYLLRCING